MDAVIDRATLPLLARLSDDALAELIGQEGIAVSAPVGAALLRQSPARFRQRVYEGLTPGRGKKHVRVLLADLGRPITAADLRRVVNSVEGKARKHQDHNHGPYE